MSIEKWPGTHNARREENLCRPHGIVRKKKAFADLLQLLCLRDAELYFAITMDITSQKGRNIRDALLMRMLVVKETEAISLEKIKCWICLFEVYNYMLCL